MRSSCTRSVLGNPDVLICGNCRECFAEITELLDHKRTYCKLRFACKCQQTNGNSSTMNNISSAATTLPQPPPTAAEAPEAPPPSTSKQGNRIHCLSRYEDIDLCGNLIVFAEIPSSSSSGRLLCVVCKAGFLSPWDLMVHVQAAHMINIYELGGTVSAMVAGDEGATTTAASTPPTTPKAVSPAQIAEKVTTESNGEEVGVTKVSDNGKSTAVSSSAEGLNKNSKEVSRLFLWF